METTTETVGTTIESSALRANDVYRLVYKDRSKIETIHFHYPVTLDMARYSGVESAKLQEVIARDKLNAAINRCKRYCDNLRFRFIHCELFLVDLDEKERIAAQSY